MYESACKLMAKQKVALECLSYHATASQDQTIKLVNDAIAPAENYKLYSFKFIGKLFFFFSLYLSTFSRMKLCKFIFFTLIPCRKTFAPPVNNIHKHIFT